MQSAYIRKAMTVEDEIFTHGIVHVHVDSSLVEHNIADSTDLNLSEMFAGCRPNKC